MCCFVFLFLTDREGENDNLLTMCMHACMCMYECEECMVTVHVYSKRSTGQKVQRIYWKRWNQLVAFERPEQLTLQIKLTVWFQFIVRNQRSTSKEPILVQTWVQLHACYSVILSCFCSGQTNNWVLRWNFNLKFQNKQLLECKFNWFYFLTAIISTVILVSYIKTEKKEKDWRKWM